MTIFFDLKFTDHRLVDFTTYKTVRKYQLSGECEPGSFTFHSAAANSVNWRGNRLELEMYNGWRYDVLRYDFDSARGTLDFGDNVGWVDRYTFNGRDGSFWYETDSDPNFLTKRGLLKRVTVLMTAPGDPIPFLAALPLLITALTSLALVFRRRRATC